MTHAQKRRLGKRVPIGNYFSVCHLPDPPTPLPECHPCHGCPAANVSGCKLFCFLPSCMREELEKPLLSWNRKEKSLYA